MRGHIQQIVDRLLDDVKGKGTMDVVADLAYPLPVNVICEMVGVPAGDRERFGQWSHDIARSLDAIAFPDPEIVERANRAEDGLNDYFHELVAERRRAPRGDLLSALIAAEEAGDRLSTEELFATGILLFIAGHETTVNLIGNGTLALLRHPDQMRRLREDPSLIASARAASSTRTSSSTARPSPRARSPSACSARPTATPRTFPTPTAWTSRAAPPTISPSAGASTSAWAPRWRAWRARSPSARCCAACRAWRWPPSISSGARPPRCAGSRGCRSRFDVCCTRDSST